MNQPRGLNATGIAIKSNDRFKHWSVNYTVISREFPSAIVENIQIARPIFQSHTPTNATMHRVELVTIPTLETKWQVEYSVVPETIVSTANRLVIAARDMDTLPINSGLKQLSLSTVPCASQGSQITSQKTSSVRTTTEEKCHKPSTLSRNATKDSQKGPITTLEDNNTSLNVSIKHQISKHTRDQQLSSLSPPKRATDSKKGRGKLVRDIPMSFNVSPPNQSFKQDLKEDKKLKINNKKSTRTQSQFHEIPVLSRRFKSHESRNYFYCRLRWLRKQNTLNYTKPIRFEKSSEPLEKKTTPTIVPAQNRTFSSVPPPKSYKYSKELMCFNHAGVDAYYALKNISECKGLSNAHALACTDILMKLGFCPDKTFDYQEFIGILLKEKNIQALPSSSTLSRPVAINVPTSQHLICSH